MTMTILIWGRKIAAAVVPFYSKLVVVCSISFAPSSEADRQSLILIAEGASHA